MEKEMYNVNYPFLHVSCVKTQIGTAVKTLSLCFVIQGLSKHSKSLLCLIYCFISRCMSNMLFQLAVINDTAW